MKHPFTTDGYVHAHDLGMVQCVVCGEKWGHSDHDVSGAIRPDASTPVVPKTS